MKNELLAGGAALLALALASCGDEAAAPAANDGAATAEKVDAMLPGEYEITTTVTAIDVTEGDSAATPLKVDDQRTHSVCVGEDGLLPPDTFGEENDNCAVDSGAYFRRGKVRQTLTCQRPGTGQINLQVNGEFTGEGVEGEIRSGTYFEGSGDYQMTRTIVGKRTGDCTAAEVEEDMAGTEVEG